MYEFVLRKESGPAAAVCRVDIQELLVTLVICFIAGTGAGIGTGFAGMSAVTVISPLLITFTGASTYEAVGIGLASDILASAVSARTYARHGNIDLKNGLLMLVPVLIMTVIGSLTASYMPDYSMGSLSILLTFLLGARFILKPVKKGKEPRHPNLYRLVILGCGIYIGFVCGFLGAGGGLMMLLILTTVLRYDLKTAVGTSVFIMVFTAAIGSVSHFVFGELPDLTLLIPCVIFTFLWSRLSSRIANRAKPETLNRITGLIMVALAVTTAILRFLNPENSVLADLRDFYDSISNFLQ